jgi:hypothetical protein
MQICDTYGNSKQQQQHHNYGLAGLVVAVLCCDNNTTPSGSCGALLFVYDYNVTL